MDCKLVKSFYRFIISAIITISLCSNTVLLVSEDRELLYMLKQLFGNSYILNSLVFVLIWTILCRSATMVADRYVIILAIFFSCFMMIGRSYYYFDSWDFLFGSTIQFLFAIVLEIGYFYFFLKLLTIIFYGLDNYSAFRMKQNSSESIFSFSKIYISVFVLHLPYILVFYPGSIAADGYTQIKMYFGLMDKTNQHPYFGTMIMGMFMQIGKLVNDDFAVFLWIIMQMLLSVLFISYVLKVIYSLNIPIQFKRICLAYYAIVPIWAAYEQVIIKDTLYYGFFMMFIALIVEVYNNDEFLNRKINVAKLTIIGICLSLWRQEGKIIFMLTIISVIIFMKKSIKELMVSLGIVLLIVISFNNILLPSMHVLKGSSAEALSIVWQGLGRYVRDYPEDVTDQERESINYLIDFESISELYDPLISDPIKGNLSPGNGEDMFYFGKILFKWFTRHPDAFIQSTLNHTYGYFYPDCEQTVRYDLQMYIKEQTPEEKDVLSFEYCMPESLRSIVETYTWVWLKLPLIGLIFRPSTPLWVAMICLMYAIRKERWQMICIVIPILLAVAVNVLSPVNGLLRYALPSLSGMPLMIMALFDNREKDC